MSERLRNDRDAANAFAVVIVLLLGASALGLVLAQLNG